MKENETKGEGRCARAGCRNPRVRRVRPCISFLASRRDSPTIVSLDHAGASFVLKIMKKREKKKNGPSPRLPNRNRPVSGRHSTLNGNDRGTGGGRSSSPALNDESRELAEEFAGMGAGWRRRRQRHPKPRGNSFQLPAVVCNSKPAGRVDFITVIKIPPRPPRRSAAYSEALSERSAKCGKHPPAVRRRRDLCKLAGCGFFLSRNAAAAATAARQDLENLAVRGEAPLASPTPRTPVERVIQIGGG